MKSEFLNPNSKPSYALMSTISGHVMHNEVTEAEIDVEWNKLKNTDLFMSKPVIHYFEGCSLQMRAFIINAMIGSCTRSTASCRHVFECTKYN